MDAAEKQRWAFWHVQRCIERCLGPHGTTMVTATVILALGFIHAPARARAWAGMGAREPWYPLGVYVRGAPGMVNRRRSPAFKPARASGAMAKTIV